MRDFHGTEYKTLRGSSYNSYLIREEKNVLIDTVDHKFSREFVQNLRREIDLADLDYIVINHAEEDHAGALTELMMQIPDTPIYCTANAIDSINGHHHHPEWNFHVVKTGDTLDIGNGKQLIFVETPMLHWPDSMMTYLTGDAVLFSNDAFGQNIASSERFSDQYDRCVLEKAIKEYYYNIVLPFSPQVLKTLELVAALKLDIEMIAPDHGLIWRGKDDCKYILDTYRALAEQKPKQRAVIVYDSMWGSTGIMASAIASGLEDEGVPVRIIDIQKNHHSDVMTELADCGAVIVGSATHNNNVLPGIADVLTYMKGLRPLNRVGAAFGSYGWSGESPKIIQEWLASMNMDMPADPVKCLFVPKHEGLSQCVALGKTVAEALKAKC